MSEWRTNSYGHKLGLGCSFLMLWALVAPTLGQTGNQVVSGPAPPSQQRLHDYTLGPNDVLYITVADSGEITGRYRVTDTGYLVLPGLSRPIKAQGLSVPELSKSIAEALEAAELMREPMVTVFVEQYHSQTVTVLGAVNKPSVYPLEKPTTLLEILSMAGGLKETAGSTVSLARKGPPPGTEGLSEADLAQFRSDWTQRNRLGKADGR